MEFKAILVDSQVRARGTINELKNVGGLEKSWDFVGIDECLARMDAEGWTHYQSLEITDRSICDNSSGHGVLLFFKRKIDPMRQLQQRLENYDPP